MIRRARFPRVLLAASALGATLGMAAAASAQPFTYAPPGELVPDSGEGRPDDTVYLPGLAFPMETGPAFANSQVWGVGGLYGPAGSQCDEANFSYPWHDNYCEERQWDMPLCPSGIGHQGQDIRGATCDKLVHWVVAGADGTVTHIGSYTVYITTDDGTRIDYLHMGNVQVQEGDAVSRGDRIGQVSNEFGGSSTTVHLHFNLQQNVSGVGTVFVPPYMSLVRAYEALVGPPIDPALGAIDTVHCEGISGWAASPAELDVAIEAKLFFDAAPGDAGAIGHPILADEDRDVCGSLGACAHGFFAFPPLSLFDGASHDVRGLAVSGRPVADPELTGGPKTFTCKLEVSAGKLRPISDDAKSGWRLSTFWDERSVTSDVIAGFTRSDDLPARPRFVAASSAPDVVYAVFGSTRRAFQSKRSLRAWRVSPIDVETVGDGVLAGFEEGPPMLLRPIVLRGPDDARFLYDGVDPTDGTGGAGGGGTGSGGAGAGGADGGSGNDGSCDCHVGPQDTRSWPSLVPLVALAAWVARRRR